MFIYHYSKELFPQLETRQISEKHKGDRMFHDNLKAKLAGEVGSYNAHISFFFDPVPLRYLAAHFEGKNDFWKEGNDIIEYTIDTDALEGNILFCVVESPEHSQWLSTINWPKDPDDAYYEGLAKEKLAIQKKHGYTGEGLDLLVKQIRKFKGTTEQAYRNRYKDDPNFEANYGKYAASVPHLMLYPQRGIITYVKAERCTVGSDQRRPLVGSYEGLPNFLSW